MKIIRKTIAVIFAVTFTAAFTPVSGQPDKVAAADIVDVSAGQAADIKEVISRTGADIAVSQADRIHAVSSHAVNIVHSPEITADWNEMSENLDAAIQEGNAQNVDILVGDSISIPTDMLSRLAGQNVTLALHTGNGITFSVSGGDIQKTDTAISISLYEDSTIPDGAKQQLLAKTSVYREFDMKEKEAYPCRVNVHVSLGVQNAGRHAVLYYYDEFDSTMKQAGSYRIQESGNAMFGLNRGDEYLVVVMEGYTVKSGDTLSHIAARKGVSLQTLTEVNPQIENVNNIRIGQIINIPNR